MKNVRLNEAQAGIKITGGNINNLRYADDTTLTAKSEEKLKSFLMRVKKSEKPGLKLNIQKTKIMESCSIISWQIEEEKVDAMTDFIFLGSKITVDSDCSHEIQRCLLLERNARQYIKKQRYHFADKGLSSHSYGFTVVMYGCESWTIKKAEC